MKVKIISALVAALMVAASVPLISGCKAATDYQLNVDEDGNKYYTASCSGFTSSLKGEYVIPAYYGEGEDYAPVTKIAQEGFAGTAFTKITIPNTVKEVGALAFAYNYQLKSVVFEEGSSLSSFSTGMFRGCSFLSEINVPESVGTIWHNAFENCENLKSIVLPEGLEAIGNMAFQYCYALEAADLPQTLTTIGYQAFYYTALKEVIIPDGVRETISSYTDGNGETKQTTVPAVGYAAFHNCTQLELAVVGKGVKTLLSGTFGYCTSLKKLYLPASLEKVEGPLYSGGELYCGHAFHSNESLTDVYYAGSAEQWERLKENIDSTSLTVKGSKSDNFALLNASPHFGEEYVK